MNARDVATYIYLELQAIRRKLDDFENMEDGSEMVSVAQEISADIGILEGELNSEFELGMDE